MRFIVFLVLLALVAAPVLAHTGPTADGTRPLTLDDIIDHQVDPGVATLHDETVNNPSPSITPAPSTVYKGWFSATVTNKSSLAWTDMLIQAQGNGVAIVQGTGLQDEWGLTGDSVICNKAASAYYSGSMGSVVYDYGATGNLFQQVSFHFTAPIAAGAKVSFKVYTDNTAYQNGSFGILFTPTVAVPEPSALLAMFTGLVGFAGVVARRRS